MNETAEGLGEFVIARCEAHRLGCVEVLLRHRGGTSACTSAANPVSELVSIFSNIGNGLSRSHLLPNGTS
jgi:hypothetical protein